MTRLAASTIEEFIACAAKPRLYELAERQCRWPVSQSVEGEHRFCAEETQPGRSYCEGHMRPTYVSAALVRRRPTATQAYDLET